MSSDDTPPEDQTAEFTRVVRRRGRRAVENLRRHAFGVTPRECPICGYYGMFTPFGMPPRLDAHCAKCGSLERHRLFYLAMTRLGLIGSEHEVLHFAPEPWMTRLVSEAAKRHVTADLMVSGVDLQLNIEEMDLPDGAFDRIVCMQVLEHVNDFKALREMYRVLRPGGLAILNTPVIEGWDQSYENPKIQEPEDRIIHFGQSDHVRYFGRDIRQRITGAGFDLQEYNSIEPDVLRFGLWRGEKLFLAWKS